MSRLVQLSAVFAFAVQPGIRIAGRGMGIVAALLPLEIGLGIARARPLGIWRFVLGAEAFLRSPCLPQRTVDREMLIRNHPLLLGQTHDLVQELCCHCLTIQAVTVLREYRVIPHRFIDGQPGEPAEQ